LTVQQREMLERRPQRGLFATLRQGIKEAVLRLVCDDADDAVGRIAGYLYEYYSKYGTHTFVEDRPALVCIGRASICLLAL